MEMATNYAVAMISGIVAVTITGLIFVLINKKKSDTDDKKK